MYLLVQKCISTKIKEKHIFLGPHFYDFLILSDLLCEIYGNLVNQFIPDE